MANDPHYSQPYTTVTQGKSPLTFLNQNDSKSAFSDGPGRVCTLKLIAGRTCKLRWPIGHEDSKNYTSEHMLTLKDGWKGYLIKEHWGFIVS